jgi:chitodextrinase
MDPDIVGYKAFYGSASGNYSQTIDVGTATMVALSNLTEGSTYFVVVTAYNAAGLQSPPSNEISFTIAANQPPIVSLTSPQAGATLNGLSSIPLTATASDPDGSISKVEFYEGLNMIGQATAAPYTALWNNAASGNYFLSATAYDNSGAATRSAEVSISVTNSTPAPSPSPIVAPKIRVRAVVQSVNAGGKAKFKISASTTNSTQPMLVNYAMGGTAISGINYTQSGAPGQATIRAGARSTTIMLKTMVVPHSGKKTAILTIQPSTSYQAPAKPATITIINP